MDNQDFMALNQFVPRQTHHTETPWALVSSIPSNKVKSTLDCWHGYHSVPLAPSDRHLTTFVPPYLELLGATLAGAEIFQVAEVESLAVLAQR